LKIAWALEFLDPAIDPCTRDWENQVLHAAAGAELKPAPPRTPGAVAVGDG